MCSDLNSCKLAVARVASVYSDGSSDGPRVFDARDCKKRNGQRLNVLASSSVGVNCAAQFELNGPKVFN